MPCLGRKEKKKKKIERKRIKILKPAQVVEGLPLYDKSHIQDFPSDAREYMCL